MDKCTFTLPFEIVKIESTVLGPNREDNLWPIDSCIYWRLLEIYRTTSFQSGSILRETLARNLKTPWVSIGNNSPSYNLFSGDQWKRAPPTQYSSHLSLEKTFSFIEYRENFKIKELPFCRLTCCFASFNSSKYSLKSA